MTVVLDAGLLERPAARRAPAAGARPAWIARYRSAVLAVDVTALLAACAAGSLFAHVTPTRAVPLVVAWILALGLARTYEDRFLGSGPEEFTRVFDASVRLTAAAAVVGYTTGSEAAGGFVAVVLPLGMVLLLLGRYAARMVVHARRARGGCLQRVLLVGEAAHVRDLAHHLTREPRSGLVVVGACLSDAARAKRWTLPFPVLGDVSSVTDALASCDATTVAVTSGGMTSGMLRELSYELEDRHVDLLVAPALTNVAGNRVSIRPTAGLPLLHVDEPELTGVRKAAKAVFDRTVALLALVLLLPVLAAIAVAVKLSSPGPVFFFQERVGQDGTRFRMWKFRSMVADAEALRPTILDLNTVDAVLFKARNDPRVTSVGRVLRRWSLDELPQLVNVLRGEMSLVGPRPPLPSEVAVYTSVARRRLLVKPGLTGLWQVSGRSDLSWDETVRLDLHYVENWSLGLDVAVLAKTGLAVLRRQGAY